MVSNPDGTIDLLPTAAAAAEATKKKAAEEAERGKPLSAAQKEVAVQCFALKLLSGGRGCGGPRDAAVLLNLGCCPAACGRGVGVMLQPTTLPPTPQFRLLTDFTLMYQHCVGVLLKRDTDLATKEVRTHQAALFVFGAIWGRKC